MKLGYVLVVLLGTVLAQGTVLPLEKASPKVQALIRENHLELVDTPYLRSRLGKGTRATAKVLLIDARPHKKYLVGHIPTAINIPDTKFDSYFPQIASEDRAQELVTYCGGWKCAKSSKLALMLREKGFRDVKIYQAGYPAWIKSGNYKEVDTLLVRSALKKADSILIDARPHKKYLAGHIPTAISIPDTQMESMLDRLPEEKSAKIILYCGGYKCAKSHNLAKKLLSRGYSNVAVYAGGLPAWTEAGLPVEGRSRSASDTSESERPYIERNGVQLVKDQEENPNMVYGPWYLDLIEKLPSAYQLVDIREPENFASGHIPGAINIPFDGQDIQGFLQKLLALDKTVILNCASGAMATEAITAISDDPKAMQKVFYVDANIECDKENHCQITINDPL